MDPQRRKEVLAQMERMIKTQGQEDAAKLSQQAKDETEIEKAKYIDATKREITEEYQRKLKQDEIKLRIQRSADQNKARILKMQQVNTMVEDLYAESRRKMVEIV